MQPRNCRFVLVLAVLLMLAFLAPRPASAQSQSPYTVVDLGTLPDYPFSVALGVNNLDQVVGSAYGTNYSNRHAFLWDRVHGMVDIGTLPDRASSQAYGINDAGQVTGTSYTSGNPQTYHAFLWDSVHGMQDLGTLPGGRQSLAYGINNLGQVVGEAYDINGNDHAFLWDSVHGMQDLGTLPGGTFSLAYGINDAGQVVGEADDANYNHHAFLWDSVHGMQDLGMLSGATGSRANGINNAGQVVGSFTDANYNDHAFVWDSVHGMVALGMLPGGTDSSAQAVNDTGQVVGWANNANGNFHAFLWDSAHGMMDLNVLTGTSDLSIVGINDAGRMIGTGSGDAVLLKPTAVVQNFSDNLQFQTNGQSMWAPGQANLTYDLPLLISWNTGVHTIGGYYDPCFGPWTVDPCFGFFGGCSFTIPGFCLGNFGASAQVGTSGQAGLKFHAYVNAGSVNVSYPITITLDFPDKDQVSAGKPFTVVSSFTVDTSAAMSTVSPSQAGASLDAIFQAQNTAHFNAQAFGATLLDTDLLPNSLLNINIDKPLFDTGNLLGSNEATNFDLDGKGILTGSVKLPHVSTAGGLDTSAPTRGTLSAHGADTFLSLRGSVTNLVATLLPFPLDIDLSQSLPGGGLNLSLDFLQLFYQANVALQQDFQLIPTPHIRLDLSNGQSVEFDAGQQVQLTMPANDPVLTITPTFTLPNTFTNNTSLVLERSGNFAPLEIRASASALGYSLGGFDATPFSTSFASTTNTFPLWQHSFSLQGFPAFARSVFTVTGKQHTAPTLSQAVPHQATLWIVDDNDPATSLQNFQKVIPGTTTLILIGDNITSDTVAYFDYYGAHIALPTSAYPDALRVQLPNSVLLLPGVGRITAVNSAGISNSLNFTILYPMPQLAPKIGPNLWASDPHFEDATLSVVGTNFIDRPDYYWAPDSNITGRLLQQFWNTVFPSGPLLPGGSWMVSNSSGNLTAPNGPTMPAFFPGFDFTAAAPLPTVYWNGQPMTLYVEPTPSGLRPSLLPNSYFASSQRAQVYLVNPGPGGGQSNSQFVLIGGPKPALTLLQPNSAKPDDPAFRLVIKGISHIPTDPHDLKDPSAQGFEANSIIYWNGQALPATSVKFISATELQADIPASFITTGAVNNVTVGNPWVDIDGKTGTYTSAPLTFTVTNPAPTLDTLHPTVVSSADPAFAGNPQFNLTLKGTHFVPNSTVCINGQARTTRVVSDTVIQATLLPLDVALPANSSLTVVTPQPGGGTSNALTLAITNAKPQLSLLTPDNVEAGNPALRLSVQGTGFYSGSVVYWNGQARPTTFVDPTLVTADLSASDLSSGGTVNITVANPAPGGGASNTLTLLITGSSVGAKVSGTLGLQGSTNLAQTLTFTLRPRDGSDIVIRTVTLGSDGSFVLTGLPSKSYNLAIKGSKWLRKVVSVDTSQGDVSGVGATLLAGDINGDNQVSLADYVLLRNAFGSRSSSSNWNANADLNCDGQVSLADYVLLRNNFGKKGDP